MLTYKINRGTGTNTLEDMNLVSSSVTYLDSGKTTLVVHKENHGLRTGDSIRISRVDGNSIFFTRDAQVTVLDINTFTFERGGDISCAFASPTEGPFSADTPFYFSKAFERDEYLLEGEGSEYFSTLQTYKASYTDKVYQTFLTLQSDAPHILVSNFYDQETDEYIDKEYNTYGIKKRCVGRHVLYNDSFMYSTKAIDDLGKYVLDANYAENLRDGGGMLNTRGKCYFFVGEDNQDFIDFMDENYVGIDLVGNNCIIDWENRKVTLTHILVPSNGFLDNAYEIRWPFEEDSEYDNAVSDYIQSVEGKLTLYFEDERFYYEDSQGNINFKPGVSFLKEVGDPIINLGLTQSFDTTMLKDDFIENTFVPERVAQHINALKDYEKQMFEPCYLRLLGEDEGGHLNSYSADTVPSDSELLNVREIEFNLHFREKTITSTEDGSVLWENAENGYWNNFSYNASGHCFPIDINYCGDTNAKIEATDADLLGAIGFDDNDIYYQRACLTQSFMRLLFYDTPDRRTQKLLFYSTVFLDTGDLFGQFCSNIEESEDESTVFDPSSTSECLNQHPEDKTKRLCARFKCFDKFDMNNCSEGFYIYLFPNIVTGNTMQDIYMKVEFNHAKFGYTTPFVMPMHRHTITGDFLYREPLALFNWPNILPPLATGTKNSGLFPCHYTIQDGTKGVRNDITELNNDMYIKLKVKYDYTKQKYIWFLPIPANNNAKYVGEKLIFNLYEPRISGAEGILTSFRTV